MCDYSLHGVANRPAKVGDKLVSTVFANTFTRGFVESGEPRVAVCLLPGSELKVDDPLRAYHRFAIMNLFGPRRYAAGVAKFVQVNLDRPDTHHDALELPNGAVVMVSDLVPGQHVTVLQLPIRGDDKRHSVDEQMRGHGLVDA